MCHFLDFLDFTSEHPGKKITIMKGKPLCLEVDDGYDQWLMGMIIMMKMTVMMMVVVMKVMPMLMVIA